MNKQTQAKKGTEIGKVTYHDYDEGYDTRVLRLGNLTFDFTEPKKHGQYIHPEISSVHSQIKLIQFVDAKGRRGVTQKN